MSQEKLQVVPPIELHSTICDIEIIKEITGSEKCTYIHEQNIASREWVIQHNLESFPAVTVVDSLNRLILCEIVYNNKNSLTVLFNSLVTGKAYLN